MAENLASRPTRGQSPGRQPREASFPQFSGYVEVQAGAGCKTVGSAYVGSNNANIATTCENGPRLRKRGPGGSVARGRGGLSACADCRVFRCSGLDGLRVREARAPQLGA